METKATKKAETKVVTTKNAKTENKKAEILANVIETVINKEQRYLYKFQLNADKLTPAKAKQYRQKLRRKMDNFYFSICLQKDSELKKNSITEFKAFYKSEFIINDFTINSLTDSKETHKVESLNLLLKAVKESLSK